MAMRAHLVSARHTNAGFGFGNDVYDALVELGVDVIDTDYRQQRSHLEALLHQPCDLLLVIKGEAIPPGLILGQEGRTALWYPDDLLVTTHGPIHIAYNGWPFDIVYGISEWDLGEYKKLGCEDVRHLPMACNPKVHRRLPNIEKKYDICFVGSLHPERKKLLARLRKSFNVHYAHVFGEDMVRTFNESRIVLNLPIGGMKSGNLAHRVFEALACGSLLFTSQPPIPDGLFEDRKHLIYYGDENLEELLCYYLDHEDARNTIAEAGRQEVLAHHTVRHRVETILQDAGGFRSDAAPSADGLRVVVTTHFSPGAEDVLKYLCAQSDDIFGVLVQGQVRPSRAANFLDWQTAQEVSLRWKVTSDINSPEACKLLRDWRPDVLVTIGGAILKPEIIGIPGKGVINLHTSMLPKYRGLSSEFWALYYRDLQHIGATIHYIDKGVDTGDIIWQQGTRVMPDDNEELLRAKNTACGATGLLGALALIQEDNVEARPQPRKGVLYFTAPTDWERKRAMALEGFRSHQDQAKDAQSLTVGLAELTYGWLQILEQEGVPFEVCDLMDLHPKRYAVVIVNREPDELETIKLGFYQDAGGRVYAPEFDVDAAILDTGSALRSFVQMDGKAAGEVVARVEKGAIRRQVTDALRSMFAECKLPYVHRWYYPGAYRSAFAFRVDADGYDADSFGTTLEVARDANFTMTWFIDTGALPSDFGLLRDLRQADQDVQLHCFLHQTFGDYGRNLANIVVAQQTMHEQGFSAVGYAAPFGIWHSRINRAMEDAGSIRYSSEFRLAYDDLPFYPVVRGKRLSRIMQVPVHPICLGTMLSTGAAAPPGMWDYWKSVLDVRYAQGEPMFLYGHPIGRLGAYPQILSTAIQYARAKEGVWETTLTEFHNWWRVRQAMTCLAWVEGSNLIMAAAGPSNHGVPIRVIYPNGAVEIRMIASSQQREETRLEEVAHATL